MKQLAKLIFLTCFVSASVQAATDLSQIPLDIQISTKPNMIFVIDDSGSMDFEILFEASDGSLWYDRNAQTMIGNNGEPLYNPTGASGSQNGAYWYKYTYLFPNGTASDKRMYGDSSGQLALPPIPQFAFARSSDYNHIYYNPNITYKPWPTAYVNGAVRTFSNATPTAARSHPIYPTSGSAYTFNLTQDQFSTSNDYTFEMPGGMVIPGSSISGIKRKSGSSWVNVTSNTTVTSNTSWDVAIPYYPATYYMKDASCTSGANCATAPDGQQLRRYEIKSGNTFPSGRSYTDELQNFANWFTYYRKRKLMLGSAMGQVLPQIGNIRAGNLFFNDLSAVNMFDLDSTTPSQNYQALLGEVYLASRAVGTPTRDALNYAGNQFKTNTSIITSACSVNAAMVLTDGFASLSGPSTPSYNSSTWGAAPPYTTIFSNSLADISLAYYTNNLRTDLPVGKVPVDLSSTAVNADLNPNLHMLTYGLTIGPVGTIFGTNSPEALDPFTNHPNWPTPNAIYSPASVDDLWHATINGRGSMFSAKNPTAAALAIQNILTDVLNKARASSAVGIEPIYITGAGAGVFAASHNLTFGNLKRYDINATTGVINNAAPVWSANDLLDIVSSSARKIATYDGASGIPFEWASLPSTMQTQLNHTISPGPNDGAQVLSWLRGDRSNEGSLYRTRLHLLGSIVNADPVLVSAAHANYNFNDYPTFKSAHASRTSTLYQGANDGMLHAFDAGTGQELWAYVPKLVFANLNQLTDAPFTHHFYVDGTPVSADYYNGSNWETLLVGGLNAGGQGYYALNVTEPTAGSESDVAAKVKWEFPNNNTATTTANNVGNSYGTPIIARTKAYGWVVLVTSGYNNTAGDGLGHLFVLNPSNGNVIADLVTTAGDPSNPSGLAKIAAFSENRRFEPDIDYVYGGDLQGNVWRFDFSGDTVGSWNVKKLATLIDAGGNPQPITSEPELAEYQAQRLVVVGTGRMLGQSDLSNTSQQSVYALIDDKSTTPTISPLRASLTPAILQSGASATDVNNATEMKGWYLDLQDAGERITNTPALALGKLIVNVNKPSAASCSTESYMYIFNLLDALANDGADLSEVTATYTRNFVGATLVSKPTLAVLPSGDVIAVIHKSDDTFSSTSISSSSSVSVKVVGWREILMQ